MSHSAEQPAEQPAAAAPTTLATLLAITAITIGYVLNPLNGSLAVTAYPQLSAAFEVPYAHMSAMVMYFAAATALGQPLAGALGDLVGRKRVFLIGIAGFAVASGMAAAAESFTALLLWRIGQAACSGVIMANGMALVAQVAPREKIGVYVGLLNSAFVAATVVGFTLGGVILQLFDWHALFLLNVPLGIVAFLLALLFIPRDGPRQPARLTALSFIGVPIVPLALALQSLVQGEAWLPWLGAFAVASGGVIVAVLRSSRSREQLRSFANLRFNAASLALLFAIALHFSVMFTLPAWSAVALGIEAAVMGLYFSIIAGSQVVSGPLVGKWVDRRGDRLIRVIALLAIAGSLLLMIFWLNPVSFAIALALFGFGMAGAQLVAQRTAMLSASESSRALAMGIFSSYRSIGGLSGNALAAVIFAGYATVTPAAGSEVFGWGFGLFLVPLALALWLLGVGRARQ
jgi:MFS family permease